MERSLTSPDDLTLSAFLRCRRLEFSTETSYSWRGKACRSMKMERSEASEVDNGAELRLQAPVGMIASVQAGMGCKGDIPDKLDVQHG